MIKAGFAVTKTYKGQKDFDTTYKDIQIKKKLVPLGPADENGEIPYTEELVEIVTETPIKDVIARSDGDCGLEAYLIPYRAAGTLPPEVVVNDEIQDFTQFDEAGDLRVSGQVETLFNSLPEDLKAKYGNPSKLLQEFNEVALKEYIASKIKKPEVENKEENKDE